MLDGVVALTRDAATVMLRPGEVVLLRPDQSLVYWNPCAAPARLLLIVAPGHDEPGLDEPEARGAPAKRGGTRVAAWFALRRGETHR